MGWFGGLRRRIRLGILFQEARYREHRALVEARQQIGGDPKRATEQFKQADRCGNLGDRILKRMGL